MRVPKPLRRRMAGTPGATGHEARLNELFAAPDQRFRGFGNSDRLFGKASVYLRPKTSFNKDVVWAAGFLRIFFSSSPSI